MITVSRLRDLNLDVFLVAAIENNPVQISLNPSIIDFISTIMGAGLRQDVVNIKLSQMTTKAG
ncbi:hypothetical protein D3C73_1417970 [compost metagenome]